MSASLPYLASPGSVKTALDKMRSAATPDRVTGDFISTKLQIKGGTGAALIPYFKKTGLVASDGTPTDLYKKFRNPSTGGSAIAEAIKIGYRPLAEVNEYFYDLNDKDLLNLIVQVTGTEQDNKVAKLTLSTLKTLKSYADFETSEHTEEMENRISVPAPDVSYTQYKDIPDRKVGLNLSYTINLNLPATSDQSVFNAIFKSLKEHLLNEQ
jgi:hypothetical protein